MTQQKPSVGRIVHYVSYGTPGGEYTSQCRAAVVTAVHPDEDHFRAVNHPGPLHPRRLDLCILNPEGMFFNRAVPYSAGMAERAGTGLCGGRLFEGGSWHWPERVE